MRRLFCVFSGCLLLPAVLLTACSEDRPRPEPLAPAEQSNLFVSIAQPANNATVRGARPLTVEVRGLDISEDRLTGLGFVTRRNGIRVDSAFMRFAARRDSTHLFTYLVPDLPTNTQLDITGIAYGIGDESVATEPVSVIVVKCQPTFPGC